MVDVVVDDIVVDADVVVDAIVVVETVVDNNMWCWQQVLWLQHVDSLLLSNFLR